MFITFNVNSGRGGGGGGGVGGDQKVVVSHERRLRLIQLQSNVITYSIEVDWIRSAWLLVGVLLQVLQPTFTADTLL